MADAVQLRLIWLDEVAVVLSPVGAAGALAVQVALANVNTAESIFQPPLSSFSVNTCWPAGRVTVAVTVVHVSQPPVAGILTEPLRLVPDGVRQMKGIGHTARRGNHEG